MIKDPPLLTVRPDFPRPTPAQFTALGTIPTGYAVDAMDGRGALDYRIKPLEPMSKPMIGVAITCHCGPADNLALFAALAAARPGDILVAATDAFTATAITGDLLMGMARNRGVAGLVTDGMVRDLVGILAVGLPVYCAGLTPNSPVRNGPGTVGLPVVLGGVTIASGDVLVGDDDGVVVIPRDQLDQRHRKARRCARRRSGARSEGQGRARNSRFHHRASLHPTRSPGSTEVPAVERMSEAELDALVRKRWRAQAEYVSAHSDFYRAHKLKGDLDELADIDFTDKDMLREDQRLQSAFRQLSCLAPEAVSRVHRTSGSTGTAMNIALSQSDALLWADVGARAMRLCGLGPGHRVVHCLNYQMWMGGYTDHAVLEATGATVIPFGVGGSERLIPTIRELGITAIHCTPSYPAVLERVIAEHFPGLKPRDLGLKLGLFGGEAGLDQPAFRKRLEDTWGFAVRNANYGVSDVLTIIAGQSAHTQDLHFIAGDVLYPELIESESGRRKPFRAGETGELVLTHLMRECQPLVRFRTGDVITITETGPTHEGITAPRFRVVGRADDMVVVRGLNMFPAMVQGIVNQFPALSGEYRIMLDAPPPYDALPLQVELARGRDAQNAARRGGRRRRSRSNSAAAPR